MAIAAREGEAKGRAEPPSLRFDIEAPGVPARTIELKQDIVRIGKLSSSHLQIQDPAVSRVHAVIEVSPNGQIYLIDLGSSNGTFVNGGKVSKERLKSGDEIMFGQTKVTLTIAGVAPAEVDPNALPILRASGAGSGTAASAGQAHDAAAAAPAEDVKVAATTMLPAVGAPRSEDDDDATRASRPSHTSNLGGAPVASPVSAPQEAKTPAASPRPIAGPAPSAIPRPEPPSLSDRERRFIAIGPAEPLSSHSEDAATIVEVRLAFGRDVIETRTFEAGRGKGHGASNKRAAYRKASEVTIGARRDCDFVILEIQGVTDDRFRILRATQDGYALCFTPEMLGRVRLGEEDLTLEDLRKRRETQQGDDANFQWPLRRGALVSIKAGGTTLYIRSVPKAPKPPVRWFEASDPRLLLSFLGVVLFSGALVWRAVTWPETPSVLLEDKLRLDDKMVNILINPEERQRRAKILAEKGKEKDGSKTKSKEQNKLADDEPKHKVVEKKKVEELTKDQQRERDIKKVRSLGALSALAKDTTLKEILAGGGGPGSMGAIGGGDTADMAEWNTGGATGPGDGSNLGAFGPGGPGTGGGGLSRYVGVGRLRTGGLRGGKSRGRFGQGEANIEDHEVKKPEVKVGEADVSGGLTREIIQRVIRSHLHEVRYCYERELVKQPRLYGKIVVKFTILPSGNVHKSGIKSSTMGNENVEGCILTRVNRWGFPKPHKGVPVIVSYPFIFKSAGKD